MRRALCLWLALTAPACADPLAVLNRALLGADDDAAWRALSESWPALRSQAQRRAWAQALAALSAEHCGKDAPLTLPAWLPRLTLELAQRDMPLARAYRVVLSGHGALEDARLLDAHGHDLLRGGLLEREDGQDFRLESADLSQPLAAGAYRLQLSAAGRQWQAELTLPEVANLDWLSRSPLAVSRLPPLRAACAQPWLEQSLLRRSDYGFVWWRRRELGEALRWPSSPGELWQSVALVRVEARGQLVLRVAHRQVGPR
ncbi:DUF2861 family protein [Chromobacterium haemolyticum]|uniref:DUF2861 domain-containing protein n=1 Tax=Chromobacterium haemolyticum TaxID=394935 RepID=A0A1W0CF11_9NEIS|nr:DUF2861 family protein [Chromobacterium haemolyticum]OQS33356.1 hypothetical protein B0T45_20390 [Chromobacterium haemolyticum]